MTLHCCAAAALAAVVSIGVQPGDRGERAHTPQARPAPAAGQDQASIDARVRRFLDDRGRSWRDMNVPRADGQLLHDLIVKHGYTRALEIGTSTGHSSIWIAWALSKTGGG
jgi:predicted O-methyltransferase YrrM